MSWESDFELLRRMMPPPLEGAPSVDWARIAESWGRAFPPDYQRFIEVYGPGGMQDILAINAPEAKVPWSEAHRDGMVSETATAEDSWEFRKSAELEAIEPLLISWGVTDTADLLCWDASGPNPVEWPILVFCRNGGQWDRYDCGMVAFLARVLRGAGFSECPIGSLDLWGRGMADFEREVHLGPQNCIGSCACGGG